MSSLQFAWMKRGRPCPFYTTGRCLFADECVFIHNIKVKASTNVIPYDASPPRDSGFNVLERWQDSVSSPTSSLDLTRRETESSPSDASPIRSISPRSPKRSPRMSSLLLALEPVIGPDDGEFSDEDEVLGQGDLAKDTVNSPEDASYQSVERLKAWQKLVSGPPLEHPGKFRPRKPQKRVNEAERYSNPFLVEDATFTHVVQASTPLAAELTLEDSTNPPRFIPEPSPTDTEKHVTRKAELLSALKGHFAAHPSLRQMTSFPDSDSLFHRDEIEQPALVADALSGHNTSQSSVVTFAEPMDHERDPDASLRLHTAELGDHAEPGSFTSNRSSVCGDTHDPEIDEVVNSDSQSGSFDGEPHSLLAMYDSPIASIPETDGDRGHAYHRSTSRSSGFVFPSIPPREYVTSVNSQLASPFRTIASDYRDFSFGKTVNFEGPQEAKMLHSPPRPALMGSTADSSLLQSRILRQSSLVSSLESTAADQTRQFSVNETPATSQGATPSWAKPLRLSVFTGTSSTTSRSLTLSTLDRTPRSASTQPPPSTTLSTHDQPLATGSHHSSLDQTLLSSYPADGALRTLASSQRSLRPPHSGLKSPVSGSSLSNPPWFKRTRSHDISVLYQPQTDPQTPSIPSAIASNFPHHPTLRAMSSASTRSVTSSVATPQAALSFAVASDNPDEVEAVLREGTASPNERIGPLSALAFTLTSQTLQNKVDIAKILLAYGADPNAVAETSVQRVDPDNPPDLQYTLQALEEISPAAAYFVRRTTTAQSAPLVTPQSTFSALNRLRYGIVGQDHCLNQLFRTLNVHSRTKDALPLVVLLSGPSGHGKSLLARKFGSILGVPTHTVNMTTLRGQHDLWKSHSMNPRKETNPLSLAEFLEHHQGQRTVVVLDEFEKTEDRKALWSLLMPWEMGRCSVKAGDHYVDTKHVIWLCTSNIGQDTILQYHAENSERFGELSRSHFLSLMESVRAELSHSLGSSLLSRVTAVLPFVPFTHAEQLALAAEAYAMHEDGIIPCSPERDLFLSNIIKAYLPQDGARSLQRAVMNRLLEL